MGWLPDGKKVEDIFIRFGATHERDRQTDGHHMTAIAALMHSKPGRPSPSQILYKKTLKGVYPFWANLYQKLPISAILGAVSRHFKSDNGEIWRQGTDLGHPPRP